MIEIPLVFSNDKIFGTVEEIIIDEYIFEKLKEVCGCFEKGRCGKLFCLDCDVFIHDTL